MVDRWSRAKSFSLENGNFPRNYTRWRYGLNNSWLRTVVNFLAYISAYIVLIKRFSKHIFDDRRTPWLVKVIVLQRSLQIGLWEIYILENVWRGLKYVFKFQFFYSFLLWVYFQTNNIYCLIVYCIYLELMIFFV